MGAGWSTSDIPDLSGKRVVVTGSNCGIGYQTALALGAAGAEVILACRSKERGEAALDSLRKECKDGKFELRLLDLSSLKDIARFADEFNAENKPLDVLVNNAGVMLPPFQRTEDGFELQIGTNHLGHFALTGRLVKSLLKSSSPRVVTVSSMGAWSGPSHGKIDFEKPGATECSMGFYGESKLYNILFMRELGRRHPKILSVGCHPGGSSTDLQRYKFGFAKPLFQSAASGALPSLRAATEASLKSGAYFAPRGFGWAGYPVGGWFPPAAKDDSYAKALWEASEKATGVSF